MKPDDTIIQVGNLALGGKTIHVMAGPCSVETREQIVGTAEAVKKAGATMLRGGAFKPRTSPYEFQGLEEDGLKLLAEARKETGLLVVTEVMDTGDAAAGGRVRRHPPDRRAQHAELLAAEAVGEVRKPVLLKRGLSATIKELLMAAEYIVAERQHARHPLRARHPHLRDDDAQHAGPERGPDAQVAQPPAGVRRPLHGIGVRKAVPAMMRAAIAAGADGLIVEVHPDPPRALSDGAQSLDFPEFEKAMDEVRAIAAALGRDVAGWGSGR